MVFELIIGEHVKSIAFCEETDKRANFFAFSYIFYPKAGTLERIVSNIIFMLVFIVFVLVISRWVSQNFEINITC